MNNEQDHRQKILLVVSEEAQVSSLCDMLVETADLLQATDMDAIHQCLTEEDPDVVILDLDSSVLDGQVILEGLRNAGFESEIIALATSSGSITEAQVIAAGADDLLTHPLQASLVTHKIKRALRFSQLRKACKDLQLIDSVTGAGTRRRMEEALKQAWNSVKRRAESLGVGVVEVDHYDAYRQHYGSEATNELMCQIVDVLKASLRRADDLITRPFEDCFVVIVPNCPLEGAEAVAANVMAAMELMMFPNDASPEMPFVTLTVGGVISWPGGDADPLLLLDQAFDAVEKVKAVKGRGQVLWTRELEHLESAMH